jgi:hypothetical protein
MPEGLIGIENLVKLEAVRNELLRIDPAVMWALSGDLHRATKVQV